MRSAYGAADKACRTQGSEGARRLDESPHRESGASRQFGTTSCLAAAETSADKAVQTELEKLATDAEYSKLSSLDQIERRMDLIDKSVEKSSGFAKCFGKMAKAHAKCAKAHESLAGHHSDLHKAAIALGDEEEAIDMQGDEEDESRAHPGGSSEKTAAEQADKLQKPRRTGTWQKPLPP